MEGLGNGGAKHRTQQADVGRTDVRIQFLAEGTIITDAMNKERSGVCQTPATAKKKEPACLEGKQAGVNIARRNTAESRTDKSSYRGIERAKGLFLILYLISIIATVL